MYKCVLIKYVLRLTKLSCPVKLQKSPSIDCYFLQTQCGYSAVD